ncbi:MAG: Fur family transcriptional regulator [Gammaproteobacteria bacterium]
MDINISEFLQQHGAKPTAQRLALAEVIFARPQHLSADELFRTALASGIRISKATVYNTLNLFAECGLVREVNVDGTRLYYDSTTHPHHHFYNLDTGELTDIPAESVRLAESPELPPGTRSVGVELVVKVRSLST